MTERFSTFLSAYYKREFPEQLDGRDAQGLVREGRECRVLSQPSHPPLISQPSPTWSSLNPVLWGFMGGFITQTQLIKPLAIGD